MVQMNVFAKQKQKTNVWTLGGKEVVMVGDWDSILFWLLSRVHCQRRQWQPTPVLLPGKSHGWRSLVGCSPWGLEESDRIERLHFHFSLSCIGEGNGNPLQCSCLENPRDGGAWWAAFYGVTQSRTRLKRLSSSSSSMGIIRSRLVIISSFPSMSHKSVYRLTCTQISRLIFFVSVTWVLTPEKNLPGLLAPEMSDGLLTLSGS